MIITNGIEKKKLLEQFYGKFYTETIEEINSNAYLNLMGNIDFIESYDKFVIAIEKPKIQYYTTLYYNAKAMPKSENVSEEEFIEYHLNQIEPYTKDYWITKETNRISCITKYKTEKSLRQLTILELKEIEELNERYKERIIKTLKALYNRNKAIITRYDIWEFHKTKKS